MTPDRIEHTHEETYCEYCGAPLYRGDRVYWDAGERHPFCSRACVERDIWFVETVERRLPPIQSLDDLAGAVVLGVKRDRESAVVLLERTDGNQVAIGFNLVTRITSEPAANARITGVRRVDHVYVFDFQTDTPAQLEVRAASYTLAVLS